ncbi:IS630 family transposase [Luteolibacter flavescens]|uniref:IS630 family transposase n=1 Tax=Luteolibacter flavescens TaxID=1859460 RepID=UPI0031B9AFE1
MREGFEPSRLVFLDESAAKTNMTRLRGRSPRGKRLHAAAPCGRWKTTTMIGAVRQDGSTTCMTVEGAVNAEIFRTYIRDILLPELRPGDILVMDNLGSHKDKEALGLLESAGVKVRFLPAYSPDYNPIELMWSKVKALLRKAEARTPAELLVAIGDALSRVTKKDATHWFSHCGYGFI